MCTGRRPPPPLQIPSSAQDPSWFNLRHHDLERNVYERWYRGHTATVTSISMCPASEAFLSTAQVGGEPCMYTPAHTLSHTCTHPVEHLHT